MLRVCQQVVAVTLASQMRLSLRWVPSEWNPSDGPSRGAPRPSCSTAGARADAAAPGESSCAGWKPETPAAGFCSDTARDGKEIDDDRGESPHCKSQRGIEHLGGWSFGDERYESKREKNIDGPHGCAERHEFPGGACGVTEGHGRLRAAPPGLQGLLLGERAQHQQRRGDRRCNGNGRLTAAALELDIKNGVDLFDNRIAARICALLRGLLLSVALFLLQAESMLSDPEIIHLANHI